MAVSGMEMMLKSLGIDTEAIKSVLNPETVKNVFSKLESVTVSLDEINRKLTRIEIKLETIPNDEAMQMLADYKDADVVTDVNCNLGNVNTITVDSTGKENVQWQNQNQQLQK